MLLYIIIFCMHLWNRRVKPQPIWSQENNTMSMRWLFNGFWVYSTNNMTKWIIFFVKVPVIFAQIISISFWYCITKPRIFRPFIWLWGGFFFFFFLQKLYSLESQSRSSAFCLLSCLSEKKEFILRGKHIKSSIWIIFLSQFTLW